MTEPAAAPALGVIIPANDEEDHIGRCLAAVLAQRGLGPGALEVIVAANGCTDATVARARALAPDFAAKGWRLEVLDIPRGGKTHALNLGDAAATAGARAYLDADVTMDPDLLAATAKALARPGPLYVAGRLRVVRAKSWVTRRYAELWTRLPFMRPGSAPGAGFFAVNAAGRARWGDFPAIISDDSFVRWRFAPAERLELPAGYDWPMVEGFAGLVRVRRRQDAGMRELQRLHPELAANEGKAAMRRADHLRLLAAAPVSYAVYVAVSLAVRLGGRDGAEWSRGRR
ncbi:glycosyltransferase [Albimonas pacifica]|uniref:Glycosyl transferase family 2 n=1 Tax=Albimonas pacifica TaxID=1114924 RepID=A0A1I3IRY9_9RHOB|nr:glycosyltransferase [Albimonas pacifica]SFI50543.1 Glycosyl transferase family 2 [Albimonas pacifica]